MAAEGGLFGAELRVVNAGVDLFADALAARGVPVSRVDWRPPAAEALARALAGRGRRGQPRGDEAARRRPARPGRRPAGARGRAGHDADDLASRRTADRVGPDERAGARGGHRRAALRAPRRDAGGGRAPRGVRIAHVRSLSPPRRGRADGRDHDGPDAGHGGRESRDREPELLDAQRGPRQGASLRGQRARRDRPAPVVRRRPRPRARRGAAADGRRRRPQPHRPGRPDGRRVPQPEPGRLRAPHQDAGAPRRGPRHRAGRARAHPQLRGGERPLLPERGDGGVQGGDGRRPRRPPEQPGHDDGAQRHRVRHPRERTRRPLVHRTVRDAGRALFPGLHRGGRQPGHGGQRDHRDRRPRRLRDGGRAGHRPVRGRDAGGRARLHPADVRDHARRERGVPAADARLPRDADRDRHPARPPDRDPPADQHGHRPSEARDRPDRRRARQPAHGVLRGGRAARWRPSWPMPSAITVGG